MSVFCQQVQVRIPYQMATQMNLYLSTNGLPTTNIDQQPRGGFYVVSQQRDVNIVANRFYPNPFAYIVFPKFKFSILFVTINYTNFYTVYFLRQLYFKKCSSVFMFLSLPENENVSRIYRAKLTEKSCICKQFVL